MTPIDSEPLAVITGASSGIGRELARWSAEHGYDLVVSAERAKPALQPQPSEPESTKR